MRQRNNRNDLDRDDDEQSVLGSRAHSAKRQAPSRHGPDQPFSQWNSGMITEEYILEKTEAYNVAIAALQGHEPASDCNLKLAYRLRQRLADKLVREIERWRSSVSAGEKP